MSLDSSISSHRITVDVVKGCAACHGMPPIRHEPFLVCFSSVDTKYHIASYKNICIKMIFNLHFVSLLMSWFFGFFFNVTGCCNTVSQTSGINKDFYIHNMDRVRI